MEKRNRRGFSTIEITAAFSVILLIGALIWVPMRKQQPESVAKAALATQDENDTPRSDLFVDDPTSSATSSATGLSPLGDAILNKVINAYSELSDGDGYSTEAGSSSAHALAETIQPAVFSKTYSAFDIQATGDVTLSRVLSYRSDLRDSLAPLLSITEPEFATFAHFVESHDNSYLGLLQRDAALYRSAASSTLQVVVPQDAVPYHLGILNAMQEFASTLDALVSHANDPFASAALLRSYNEAESTMLTSFNSLAQYYRAKANAAGAATSTHS